MYKGKKILGIIPARGGSKGVPHKNIRLLAGKPLIVWTIELALKSGVVDRLIVSTDHPEIAKISMKYGAEVPFLRPAELATDQAKGIDVVLHAIRWHEDRDDKYELLLLLQPTSPLRQVEDITSALKLYEEKEAEAVVSVCEAEHSPFWINTLDKDLCMRNFITKDILKKNRQELGKYYQLNGAIYLANPEYIKKDNGFFGKKTFAYIMKRERSIDIDLELDFKVAEILLSENFFGKN